MALIITAVAIALLIYVLEHTRNRQAHPGPRLAGSTDITDRDTERITAELRTRP